MLSSFWAELDKEQLLGRPAVLKTFDMHQCSLEDVQVGKVFVFRRKMVGGFWEGGGIFVGVSLK